MSNDEPVIAKPKPYLVPVKQGNRYAWCACGRSKAQPFCDGSHSNTVFKPVLFTAAKTEDILLCGCKHTRSGPYCDGAHNNLQDTYEEASEAEITAMKAAKLVARNGGATGKALLDGGAYVLTPDFAAATHKGALSVLSLIAHVDGAEDLSLCRFAVTQGCSPWRQHKCSDTVLFVISGKGVVHIEDTAFEATPETGIFIRMGEAFRIEAAQDLQIVAAICPHAEAVLWSDQPTGSFDQQFPERRVSVDHTKTNVMADRFYQVLVDNRVGSTQVTQFIGEVPLSRAAFHRHLYEEAIVILSGEGMMWTENCRAPVSPGDVIYLPPRQGHSLECTSNEGMRLMGVFYPAGSPAINY